MMDGLAPSLGSINDLDKKRKSFLKPKQCPNCDESNKPEARLCAKCKFVLSFDAFNETMEESEKTKNELEALRIEREKDKKALAELLESKQKQFEERIEQMEERQERIYEELFRKEETRLNKIKNKDKRNAEETKLLWDAAAAAEVELEEELEDEAAQERLAAYMRNKQER